MPRGLHGYAAAAVLATLHRADDLHRGDGAPGHGSHLRSRMVRLPTDPDPAVRRPLGARLPGGPAKAAPGLRNYPISAHIRFLLEEIRPEMRQYFFESEKDGMPFSRDIRAVIYQRAKMVLDKRPFGTQEDVYKEGYEWMHHSVAPKASAGEKFRVTVGGPDCAKPYSASVFNISAMSFGALSPNAVRSLNAGARKGGFAHDTGEGGFSPYHAEMGGDIIWEIGSGYFGCRHLDGALRPQGLSRR